MPPAPPGPLTAFLQLLRWFLLAFVSGVVNTGGFLACGRFVSHVTGFATLFGMSVGDWNWIEAISVFTVPLYFMLGGIFSAWMVDRRIQVGLNPFYALPLFVVTALLLAVVVCGTLGYFGDFGAPFQLGRHYFLLVLLCLASGIQNAVVTTATGTILRSSHLTGTTTDLSTGLVRCFLMPGGSIERRLETRLNWMRCGTIAFFILGAVVGDFGFSYWGFLGFVLPAIIAAGVGVWIALRHK